jgi:hypothetical protein
LIFIFTAKTLSAQRIFFFCFPLTCRRPEAEELWQGKEAARMRDASKGGEINTLHNNALRRKAQLGLSRLTPREGLRI